MTVEYQLDFSKVEPATALKRGMAVGGAIRALQEEVDSAVYELPTPDRVIVMRALEASLGSKISAELLELQKGDVVCN